MAKQTEKQNTNLEKQRSLSAFGFGRSVTQRPGPSTSESAEGKTSLPAVPQRESPCKKKHVRVYQNIPRKMDTRISLALSPAHGKLFIPPLFSGKGMNTP